MRQLFKSRFARIANKLGAELSLKPASEFCRRMLYRVPSRPSRRPPVVLVDRPRDLDDPLSDPNIQARVGETIAKQAKKRPK